MGVCVSRSRKDVKMSYLTNDDILVCVQGLFWRELRVVITWRRR